MWKWLHPFFMMIDSKRDKISLSGIAAWFPFEYTSVSIETVSAVHWFTQHFVNLMVTFCWYASHFLLTHYCCYIFCVLAVFSKCLDILCYALLCVPNFSFQKDHKLLKWGEIINKNIYIVHSSAPELTHCTLQNKVQRKKPMFKCRPNLLTNNYTETLKQPEIQGRKRKCTQASESHLKDNSKETVARWSLRWILDNSTNLSKRNHSVHNSRHLVHL